MLTQFYYSVTNHHQKLRRHFIHGSTNKLSRVQLHTRDCCGFQNDFRPPKVRSLLDISRCHLQRSSVEILVRWI
ncbi:hypothetical protein WG66_012753 [Moniliophthora roreri]|nr:hypothetical protein WG66_012753 [Moniliophthora roreri]